MGLLNARYGRPKAYGEAVAEPSLDQTLSFPFRSGLHQGDPKTEQVSTPKWIPRSQFSVRTVIKHLIAGASRTRPKNVYESKPETRRAMARDHFTKVLHIMVGRKGLPIR